MKRPSPLLDLASALCEEYPNTPTKTLAAKLLRENPEATTTLEAARSAVRTVRGANGDRKRKWARVPRPHQAPHNPMSLPDSFATEWTMFEVDGDERIGIFGDVHIPYHDITALTAYLQWLKRRKPTILFINGDLNDFHMLSRFEKDPKARTVAEERAATLQFFGVLREQFPHARIILKQGNHDERLAKYLAVKAPELLNLRELEYESIFQLDNYGIEMVAEKRVVRFGKLPVIHGHEYPTPVIGPVNAARGLFLRAKTSSAVNHHHQVSEHTENTLKGEMITCWSVGCLCDLHPAYSPLNKWSHGGAFMVLDKSGDYEFQNKRILHGRVV
jgi:predicted phosphodiesterase